MFIFLRKIGEPFTLFICGIHHHKTEVTSVTCYVKILTLFSHDPLLLIGTLGTSVPSLFTLVSVTSTRNKHNQAIVFVKFQTKM